MWGFAKAFKPRHRARLAGSALALALVAGATGGFAPAPDAQVSSPALGEGSASAAPKAPLRVVSVNLCTDQLAMLLAAPGQLVSVSHLASEPQSSSMAAAAAAYPMNRGQAEQVFLLRPDLVLAGTYTSLASVTLLRQLGIEVLQLPPANSLADAAAQIRTIGAALGQTDKAEAMATALEADIAAARYNGTAATAALYYPNGYTTGAGTLANEVLELTGFRNIGAEAGITGGGTLPLERLVMAAPDLIVTSQPYPGASRAEEILAHPALSAAKGAAEGMTTDADWVCGTPHILRAIARMQTARAAVEAAR